MAGAAACTLPRLHAAVINTAAAVNTPSPLQKNTLLLIVIAILILQNVPCCMQKRFYADAVSAANI
jgi:hypothetical protein